MKKKLLLGVSTACLATLALASCGGGNSNELKTMSMFGGADAHAPAYEALIAEFEKENNIDVKDNSAQADETWKTGVISAFKSGNDPDVLFYFTGADAKPLVDGNYVVPVSEIRKAYPDYAKNIGDGVLDPYAVTLKGFVEGLFVNTDVLKAADLKAYADKETWTWEDFLAVCDALKAKEVTPVALGAINVPHYWIEHLVFGMAGLENYKTIPAAADLKAATGEGNTAADKWVKGLKMFNTLAERGVFGATKGNQKEDVSSKQFKDGKAAMQLDGSWFAGQMLPDKDGNVTVANHNNVKMIPFPAIPTSEGGSGKVNLQSGFTSGFFISRKAWNNPEKREAAVKFVEKMTCTSSVARFCKEAGGVPADASVVIDGLTPLQKSMNTMTARTQVNSLPLSNMCKAGTFDTLVAAAPDYLLGKLDKIQAALEKFASQQ